MTNTRQGSGVDAVAAGMSARRIPVRIPVALLLGVYLVGMGVLSGMAISAMRFDQQRSAVLAQLNDASTRVRARLMEMEKDAARGASPDTTREGEASR
jgi:hypothetical protein